MKKLMLGLMMAFAVTAEAEVKTNVQIGDLKYSLDTEAKTATITGYTGSPTEVDVAEVEDDGGEKYTVTSVGMAAFLRCGSLTSVYLPNATTIGGNAFSNCGSLEKVSLPNATTIELRAFYNCQELTSVYLPNATTIGMNAFYQCGLTSVSLSLATTIGESAFQGCSSLTSVYLPNATTIERDAFSNCGSLEKVSLPNATTIGMNAFLYSNVLSSLLVNVEMKSAIETNGRRYYGISSDTTITYYDGLPYSVVKAAEYEVNEAVVEIGITPSSVTLKNGDEVLDEEVYKKSCDFLGLSPLTKPDKPYTPTKEEIKFVHNDSVVVKKESIQAAKAETISVADGVVTLNVNVCSNGNFTAETSSWEKAKITDVKLNDDGTVTLTVPVSSASGFMILQSKDAKIETAE